MSGELTLVLLYVRDVPKGVAFYTESWGWSASSSSPARRSSS